MADNDEAKPWRERATEDLQNTKQELEERKKVLDEAIRKEIEENNRAFSPNPKWYVVAIVFYAVIQTVVALWSLLWGMSMQFTALELNPGVMVLTLQVLHFLLSWKSIGVDDLAGVDFFGRPVLEPEPGLCFVPLFLLQLMKVKRNYQDKRFPGPADKVFRVSTAVQSEREFGDAPTPEQQSAGMVRPIFAITGEPKLTQAEQEARKDTLNVDPFDERLTIEVAYVIRYRPNQEMGGIFRIVRNIGVSRNGHDLDGIIADLLRENSERDVKAIIARHTLATLIDNLKLFNEVFALQVQVSVLRLGIQIDYNGTGADDLNPSHETNKALAEARRARFARQKTLIDADAEKQHITEVGRGNAEAERLLLEARAAGYKRIKEDAGTSGEIVIASETARTFKDANTIFGAQGIKEILAMPGLLPPQSPRPMSDEPKKEDK